MSENELLHSLISKINEHLFTMHASVTGLTKEIKAHSEATAALKKEIDEIRRKEETCPGKRLALEEKGFFSLIKKIVAIAAIVSILYKLFMYIEGKI